MPPKRKAAKVAARKVAEKRSRREEKEEENDEEEEEIQQVANGQEEEEEEPKKRTRKASKAAGPAKKKTKKSKASKAKDEEEDDEEDEEEEEEEEDDDEEGSGNLDEVAKGKAGTWVQVDTLYVLNSGEHRDKIAAFDMDHTIVYPKSGAKFAKSRGDWAWLLPEVVPKLKELHKTGYKVVIFTNQAGIEKKNTKPSDITGKILDLQKELGFPLQAFVAGGTDKYRKPNTTMWRVLENHCNGKVAIDYQTSFYCGDAAGRAKGWAGGKPKDFNCSDRAFAHNVGVKFHTPEEFFLKQAAAIFAWDGIDPQEVLKTYLKESKLKVDTLPAAKQEMVILVGNPASGKSTFFRTHFKSNPNYVWVNCDTLKTKDKCLKVATSSLAEGKSVVIDNTNPSKSVRAEYLRIAKSAGVSARCFHLQTPLDVVKHLNSYREKLVSVRRVPEVAYRQFNSKFEAPKAGEGFTEVTEVPFVLKFEADEHKKLFLERTCPA